VKTQVAKLKDVAKFINGKAFKPTDWSETGLPIIRIQNLNNKERDFNYWSGALDKQVLVEKNNLLFAWSGTPGTSFGAHIWSGERAVLNQHIFRVDLNNTLITKNYAKLVINAKLNKLIEQAHGGVGLQHVTKGMVENLEIPLPPIAEQKRIAEILDKANEIKDKREIAIKLTEKLINDLFLFNFGDPTIENNISKMMTLDEICTKKGEYGANLSAVNYSDNLPRYIRITDIDDLGNLSDKKVSPNGNEHDWEKYKLNLGDLLFARTGATVGKTYLHNIRESNYIYAGYLIRFKPKVEIADSTYLFAFTKTNYYKQWVLKSQNVVAQPNINAKQYGSDLKIPIPPLELQQKFSHQVNKIYQQINYLKNQNGKFDNLISSLQNQAFTTGFNA
jgi:type I restriction enzyme S subunit